MTFADANVGVCVAKTSGNDNNGSATFIAQLKVAAKQVRTGQRNTIGLLFWLSLLITREDKKKPIRYWGKRTYCLIWIWSHLFFFFFYFLFIYVTDCSDKGSVRTMGMIGNQGGFWTTKVKFEQQIWRALIGLNSSTVFRIYKPLIWHSSVCRKLCAVLVDMSMPMGNGQYSW